MRNKLLTYRWLIAICCCLLFAQKPYAQTVNKDSVKSMRKAIAAGKWVARGNQHGFVSISPFATSNTKKLKFGQDSVRAAFGFIPLIERRKQNQSPIALSPPNAVIVSASEGIPLTGYDPDGDLIDFEVVTPPNLVVLTETLNRSGVMHYTPNDGLFPNRIYKDTLSFKVNEALGEQLTSAVKKFPFQFRIDDEAHQIQRVEVVSQTSDLVNLSIVFTDPMPNATYQMKASYFDLTEADEKQISMFDSRIPQNSLRQVGSEFYYDFSIAKADFDYVFSSVNVIFLFEIETETNFDDSFAFILTNPEENGEASETVPLIIEDDFKRILSEGGVFFPFGSKKKTKERKRVSNRLYAADVSRAKTRTVTSAYTFDEKNKNRADFNVNNVEDEGLVANATVKVIQEPKQGIINTPYTVMKSSAMKIWEISYLPTGNQNYTDTIVYEVTSGAGEVRTVASLFEVEAVNDPPVFKRIPNQKIDEEQPVEIMLDYSDPDPDAELAVTVASEEADDFSFELIGKKLIVVPNNDFNGLININIEVRELNTEEAYAKFQNFGLKVEPVNDQPIVSAIADQEINEDEKFIKVIEATDADLSFPIFSYTAVLDQPDAAVVEFEEDELNIIPDPNFNGTLEVKLVANDREGFDNSVSDTVKFTLNILPVNDQPTVVSTIPAQSVIFGNTLSIDLKSYFNDIETAKSELVYSIEDNQAFSSSISNGVLSIDAVAESGVFPLAISASDKSLSATQTVSFKIVKNQTNYITAKAVANVELVEDFALYQVDLDTIFETNNGTLSYASSGLINLSSTIEGSILTVKTKQNFTGNEKIKLVASTNDESAIKEFTINVTPVNDLPKIIMPSSVNMVEDEPYLLQIDLEDVDTDFADLSLTVESSNATYLSNEDIIITKSNGHFFVKLSPKAQQFGELNLVLSASDGNGSVGGELPINILSVNDEPVRVIQESITAVEDAAMSLDLNSLFNDEDGDNIEYKITSYPEWLTLNGSMLSGTPSNDDVGETSIFVTADDKSGGVVTESFLLNVANTNDAPSLKNALSNVEINEDVFASIGIDTTAFLDVDGDQLSYEVTFSENAWLSYDAVNKRLSGTPLNDNVGNLTIQIKSSDPDGAFIDTSFEIIIKNTNDTPTEVSLSANTINENETQALQIGTLSTVDVDVADTHSYAFVDGENDNEFFEIIGNELYAKSTFNFEQKALYTVTILSTDAEGLSVQEDLNIVINDVDETPEGIILSSYSFDENVDQGFEVATIQLSTPDEENQFIGFSLVSGDGDDNNDLFEIVNGKLNFLGTANYEVKKAFSIRIQSEFNNGITVAERVELTLNNVNEAPTELSMSSLVVDENYQTTVAIADILFLDEDENDQHAISFVAGDGSTDNDLLLIGNQKLYFKASPNFETKELYAFRISVTDAAGETIEGAFELSIVDVNEVGTAITLSSESIVENNDANALIGSLSTDDPDNGDSQTYQLVDGTGGADNAYFSIVEDQLFSLQSFNYEEKNAYSIRLSSTDNAGNSLIKLATIQIGDVNDAPTDISTTGNLSIEENIAIGSIITELTAQDEDSNDVHSYTLIEGEGSTDNGLFKLENNQLLTNAEIDYEAKSSLSIRIKAEDQDGALFEKAITLSVQNILEGQLDLVTSLEFGNTDVGETTTLPLEITNSGELAIQVNSVSLPRGFSLSQTLDEIQVGEKVTLNVNFTPTQDQNYQGELLIVTNIGGFKVNLSGIGSVVTSIEGDPFSNVDLKFYPNPAATLLTLDLTEIPLRVQQIRITDIEGRNIFSTVRGSLDMIQIQVGNYNNGVYLISLMHKDQVLTKKFIIKH